MKISTLTLSGASLVLSIGLAAGCSATVTSTNPVKTTDAGKDTGTAAKPDAGAEKVGSLDASTNPTNPDDLCAGQNDQCIECCVNNHSTGYQTYMTTFMGCACQASVCQKECAATFCATSPANPDAACNACLDGQKAAVCDAPLQSACGADNDCMDLMACAQTCPQ